MSIKEIKQQLSILTVLAHYGLVVKNGHIHCPFHTDKTPSMKVYTMTNTVHCFSGNCEHGGKSMDVIDFVMYLEKCSKHQAILKCKKLLGALPLPKVEPPTSSSSKPTSSTPMTKAAMAKLWTGLRESLRLHKRGNAYLESRGLHRRGIGYHSGKLKGTRLEAEALAAGLILPDGRSWGAGCLLFPLRNELGEIVSFYGRSITGSGHYYQMGRSGLYPGYPSVTARRVLLTESVIDAASLVHAGGLGGYEILALYGCNGLRSEHKAALQGLQELEEVVLMLDGDEAGQAGSAKYSKELSRLLPKVWVREVILPGGTDVNELWANYLDVKLFEELLEEQQKIEVMSPVSSPAAKEQVAVKQESKLDSSDASSLVYQGQAARYAVKGFQSGGRLDSLKVTLETKVGPKKYRGKVELYQDSGINKYCQAASTKLGVDASVMDVDLGALTDELEAYRKEVLAKELPSQPKVEPMSSRSRSQAQAFLRAPNLFHRLGLELGKSGIVGEEQKRLMLLLVASSYKQEAPLHALIQGSSGSGKTLLLRKIMHMLPVDKRYIWTRVSDKSLYHAGTKFKHTAIAVEDWDGLSEEVQFVVRELQSGHRLGSSITVKDASGNMNQREIVAEGPIASLMCTTRGSVYEDNMSRCLLVAVDESEAQTERILAYQYKKERGELDKEAEDRASYGLQCMVQVLAPFDTVNPYAGQLTLPKRVHKLRRLNTLFQGFVRQITWWHQYQRARDTKGRLITTKEDLRLAVELLYETIVLKVDELDGSLRQFYEQLKDYVLDQGGESYRFTRREIRQALGVSKTQQHRYLGELQRLEYLRQVAGHQNTGYAYQIIYWDDNEALRKQIKDHLHGQIFLL